MGMNIDSSFGKALDEDQLSDVTAGKLDGAVLRKAKLAKAVGAKEYAAEKPQIDIIGGKTSVKAGLDDVAVRVATPYDSINGKC